MNQMNTENPDITDFSNPGHWLSFLHILRNPWMYFMFTDRMAKGGSAEPNY